MKAALLPSCEDCANCLSRLSTICRVWRMGGRAADPGTWPLGRPGKPQKYNPHSFAGGLIQRVDGLFQLCIVWSCSHSPDATPAGCLHRNVTPRTGAALEPVTCRSAQRAQFSARPRALPHRFEGMGQAACGRAVLDPAFALEAL